MDYSIRDIQLKQLEILKAVKQVCDDNGIRFYIAFGTCLGAVRHGGAIPWDDDIDIIMHVKDYDKFIKCQSDFGDKFFLQNIFSESDFSANITRVRMNGTTIIEAEAENLDIHQGAFIDVYPLYGCPDNLILDLFRLWDSHLLRLLLMDDAPKNHGTIAYCLGKIISAAIPESYKKKLIHHLYISMRNCNPKSKYVAVYFGMGVGYLTHVRYRREWFEKPKYLKYENVDMPVPSDYDSFLKATYGDYMKLPPIENRKIHHSYMFVDLENNYDQYKGIEYLKNNKEKK